MKLPSPNDLEAIRTNGDTSAGFGTLSTKIGELLRDAGLVWDMQSPGGRY